MLYDAILASWREKKIRTAADIALEMNGNGAAFIYHSAKIENDSITYQDGICQGEFHPKDEIPYVNQNWTF